MDLLVIGLSHRTASLALRERLAVDPGDLETRVRDLMTLPGLRELMLVSTCNRMEIYASYKDGPAALSALRKRLEEETHDKGDDDLGGHLYERMGHEAVHHLFRVTASLDSMVVGEPQILGQMKAAFEQATQYGVAGPTLSDVFARAFRVARRIRRETGIAKNPVSISSVAVDLARLVWDGFAGRRVLLVGAGKMADLASRALKADGAVMAVTNRTPARADELAARLGAQVEPWEKLGEAIGRADIVISSTGAREPVIKRTLVAEAQKLRRGKPLVLIDIAVPRDVEPGVGDLAGVFLYDIDHLQQVASHNLDGRRQEADRAEAMVEEEVAKYLATSRGREVGPTIAALRAQVVTLARREAERTVQGLGPLDDKIHKAILALGDAIAAKMMHTPSVVLKKNGGTDDGEALADAARKLFELPEPGGGKEDP